MEEILNNIVSRIILPKFPWMDSWDYENFHVIFYLKDDIGDKKGYDIWVETKNLFSMLNPKKNQGVEIRMMDKLGKVIN